MQTRKQEEIDFHNNRELKRGLDSFEQEYPNQRFYQITKASQEYRDDWIKQNCAGKKVLDFCCGNGELSCLLAEAGADVVGVDISNQSIRTAQANAQVKGLGRSTQFLVMDAENLEFPEESFDVVVCCGVLHHLELRAAYRQIARVLKPGGSAMCIEALAHNPFIHHYRKNTPQLRTSWEVEHILTVDRIEKAKEFFSEVRINYFHLAALAAIALIGKPGFKSVLDLCNLLDKVLTKIPLLQRWSWQAIFILKKSA